MTKFKLQVSINIAKRQCKKIPGSMKLDSCKDELKLIKTSRLIFLLIKIIFFFIYQTSIYCVKKKKKNFSDKNVLNFV